MSQNLRNRTPEINHRVQTTRTPEIPVDRLREILSAPRIKSITSNEAAHRASMNYEEGVARAGLPRVSTMMTSSLLRKELLNMSTALAHMRQERKEVNQAFDRYQPDY